MHNRGLWHRMLEWQGSCNCGWQQWQWQRREQLASWQQVLDEVILCRSDGSIGRRFEKLSYLARDRTDRQLIGTFIEELKSELEGVVKAWEPRTVAASIFVARIQEERLNQDARRMRTTPRPMAYKPPSIPSRPSLPKELSSEELYD
ncbi:hypothetical protein BHM03_00052919 [Ensete ventricosum]|uniref:Retrotransposon gag domain-containing protein n=1 Tax=Ensete ventricosum TaxID=4639 RepID=A0A445MM21_ENSVE|nr:hypothetical protein BHM03_00052919 [Ensete ventricosum]